MKHCANCGEPLKGTPKFCPNCGKQLVDWSSQEAAPQQKGKKTTNLKTLLPLIICGVLLVALVVTLAILIPQLSQQNNPPENPPTGNNQENLEPVKRITGHGFPPSIITLAKEVPGSTVFEMRDVFLGTGWRYELSKEPIKSDYLAYTMSLSNNGEEFDPDGKATVAIDLPSGFSTKNVVVYLLRGSTVTKLNATVSGDFVTFDTYKMGVIVIAHSTE